MNKQRIRLWDLPTRLFHWLLVMLVLTSFISGKIGGNAMEWHGKCGLAILGLLAFRLIWGIVGSTYARFASFFPTPATVAAYLRGEWRGLGHNPLGAFSVFGLLGLLAFQVVSGLFGNDDIAFRGYLYDLIGKDLSDRLTGWHKLSVNLLIALVALHVSAILFYARVKKDNLVKPMLTGWKEVDPGEGGSATGGGPLALIVALLVAVAAVYGGSGAWLPTPSSPVATPSTTPAW
ncbi:cytochrome b/b6 domain-containing protein [Accumulibacter sp.]|uniref:cytochrome b/b6 domain-containing protein n=1 Tax=Accumulibacter sp. TaxID=2053492 RepID=UPI0026317F58|nr:cytochrome b/b6 domain-containing protein [Accumulibacter sp.]